MKPYNERLKNTTSRSSLAKILFEEDGGDGGAYEAGGEVSFSGMRHGGGSGSVQMFHKAFIEPFHTLLQAIGYSVEKTANAAYYFAKKIIVNIPRLFNPATPLIFDDIRDEEKAAYQRLDKRYADTLQKIQENFNNKDLKAIAFMLYPSQMLSLTLLKKAPEVSYRTLNTLSGNKISDFVENVKQAYYSLPAQRRSRERIAALVRRYEEADRREAERKKFRTTNIADAPSGYSGYGYDYNYSGTSADDYMLEEKKINVSKERTLTNEEFLPIAFEMFPERFKKFLEPAFEKIKTTGQEAMENIIEKTEENLKAIDAVIASKDAQSYSVATGVDVNKILKLVDDNMKRALKEMPDVEKLEPEKRQELEKAIEMSKKEIEKQTFEALKKDYLENQKTYLESVKVQFEDLLKTQLPMDLKNKVEEILRKVNKLS